MSELRPHTPPGLLLLISCFLLLASCVPDAPSTSLPAPTSTSIPAPTPIPSSTSTSTPVPTPVPEPTAAPTLDPGAVTLIVAAGEAELQARGIQPLCLRWEDTDGDGQSEWVGLYLQPGEPPELMGFVLDGGAWHDLRALEGEEHGLGEYAACELEVRDLNADGRVEILIWGHAGSSTELLHIFVWDGVGYTLLAPFEGKAGVRLENTDGDLIDEVVVRYNAGDGLVWEAVYVWDGSSYGWTWERYDWFFPDRPHVYLTDTSEHAVVSFYLALGERDLPGAYDLLSPSARAAQPYESWAAGFATTLAVEAGAVYEVERSGETATVTAQVRAYDNVDGRAIATLWDVQWSVVQTPGGWRLASAMTNQLDQWETPYYP